MESIKAAASKASGSSRRGAAADDKKEDDKPKRSSNPAGVSVGQRIKDIIADDLDITEDKVGAILKKEGLEFKDTSLRMNFADCAKFLVCLRAAKRIK